MTESPIIGGFRSPRVEHLADPYSLIVGIK